MKERVMDSSAQLVFAAKMWWNAKSERMSEMIGEDCTHSEVVLTDLVFTVGVMAVAVLGTMFG